MIWNQNICQSSFSILFSIFILIYSKITVKDSQLFIFIAQHRILIESTISIIMGLCQTKIRELNYQNPTIQTPHSHGQKRNLISNPSPIRKTPYPPSSNQPSGLIFRPALNENQAINKYETQSKQNNPSNNSYASSINQHNFLTPAKLKLNNKGPFFKQKTKSLLQLDQMSDEQANDKFKEEKSIININLRRKTGIFQHQSCPIDNQIIEQLDKQLGKFVVQQDQNQMDTDEKCLIIEKNTWQKIAFNNKQYYYIGQWMIPSSSSSQPIPHGQGSLYQKKDQTLISGLFHNSNLWLSKCRVIFPSGCFYVGQLNPFFQPSGQGTMYFKNGDRYRGKFYKGVPHGEGKETKANGEQFQGVFQNGFKKFGVLNQGQIHGNGSKVKVYQGEFQNNMRHGIGTVVDENGRKIQAEFRKNKVVRRISVDGININELTKQN